MRKILVPSSVYQDTASQKTWYYGDSYKSYRCTLCIVREVTPQIV